MAESKYNLDALKDRKVTSTITAWLNGRATQIDIEEQLDKIFIVEGEEPGPDPVDPDPNGDDGDGDGGEPENNPNEPIEE